MPSADRASASASMRAMASSRALYMAWVSTLSSWLWFHRWTWIPTWYIEVPITRPTGVNPHSLTRANSLTERSLVNRALPSGRLVDARRVMAAGGSGAGVGWSVMSDLLVPRGERGSVDHTGAGPPPHP